MTFWQALLALFVILISLHFLGVPVLPLVVGIFGIAPNRGPSGK